jgi:DNA-directed RNA polymerase beta subunit
LDVLKTFAVEAKLLKKLFSEEDLDISNYSSAKVLEVGTNLPNFLFTEKNSYFYLGELGRKKFQKKANIFQQIEGQILAENLHDSAGKIILLQDSILAGKNLQILKKALVKKKINSISLPSSTNDLYYLKVRSPQDKEKIIIVVGTDEEATEEKTYFDLADLICTISLYLNLHHGLGDTEKEEEKDNLENQVVRRVGDLVYNLFDIWMGVFLKGLNNKYLTYISQLKKVDLLKIPNLSLKDFDSFIKRFFNTSSLVQLQNQNNTLSQISSILKLIVYGEGGFKPKGATLAARNIKLSHRGRYDLVETPEGQRVGLVHNLTVNAKINDYGQVSVPYYLVKNGVVTSQLVYLSSEEE